MHLQVAADLSERDQLGQHAGAGGLNLTPVLAKLGWDPGKVDGREHFFFAGAGHQVVPAKDAVLVNLETALPCDSAHGDVMRFGTSEVVKSGAVTLLGYEAQVDLQTAFQAYRALGWPLRDDVFHQGRLDEAVHDRGPAVGCSENVQVAYRFTAASVTSGDLEIDDSLRLLQVLEQWPGVPVGLRELEAAHPRLELLDPLEHPALQYFTEPRQLEQSAIFRRLLQVVNRGDIERLP